MESLKAYFHRCWVSVKRLLLRLMRRGERLWPLGRPALEYVETHLVDHCNMNCCGCSHFSPLAEPWFARVEDFRRDMEALARLFRSIRTIRLMGGEPLLHPQVERFLVCARSLFPRSRVRLVTNGLLLDAMPETFWACCRKNRIGLSITIYPPMRARAGACAEMCREQGVHLTLTRSDQFCVWLNKRGDSPVNETFVQCRKTLYCPVLKDGRLYTCATAAYSELFNRRFGPTLPQSCGLALNEEGLTGRKVLGWLDRPVELCGYCAREKGVVAWKNGRPEKDDWFIATTEWSQWRE